MNTHRLQQTRQRGPVVARARAGPRRPGSRGPFAAFLLLTVDESRSRRLKATITACSPARVVDKLNCIGSSMTIVPWLSAMVALIRPPHFAGRLGIVKLESAI